MMQTDLNQLGPLMVDVAGFYLTDQETQRLAHQEIGGVILFRRNFESIKQLEILIAEIKAIKNPALIIAVDHEGGRVQRFINGFTRLPAMRTLGCLYDSAGADVALDLARKTAWVLATELRCCGVDLSFTPVLDLDWGHCAVIGNRSFHSQPDTVVKLAEQIQQGLNQGGMIACGKHFPGHGFVAGDSHHSVPVDERSLDELWQYDIIPFEQMVKLGMAAIMPAHVIYPQVDNLPAGFSSIWLKQILRDQLGFQGAIFSDDLTMEGAAVVGTIKQRAQAALEAGCDILLVCNRPDLVDELLNDFPQYENIQLAERWNKMRGKQDLNYFRKQLNSATFKQVQQQVATLFQEADMLNNVVVGESS